MLVATELPLHCQAVLSALTDYDFVIGPVCLEHTEYLEFYKGQRWKGRLVILDNGAFEGGLLPVDALLELVRQLYPQEVVAPDVIGDRKETFEKAKEFTELLRASKLDTRVQVCPQGSSFEEWVESYQELADLPGVSTIGVSYVGHFTVPEDCNYFGAMAAQETVRLRFFHHLIGRKILRSDKQHHLLGLYSPAALRWYARYPFIRSIDTSFPVVCALFHRRMTLESVKLPEKLDYKVEFDDDQLAMAVENICWMRKECSNGGL